VSRPVALLYRWQPTGLEFAIRNEAVLSLAMKLGWRLLAKDSDLPKPAATIGEEEQD